MDVAVGACFYFFFWGGGESFERLEASICGVDSGCVQGEVS